MCHLVFRAGELVGGNMSLCVLDLCGQGGVTLILCSIYKSKYHRSPNRTYNYKRKYESHTPNHTLLDCSLSHTLCSKIVSIFKV